MTVPVVCSLKVDTPQLIAPGGYHMVRFPTVGESTDPLDMHPATQPDGHVVKDWKSDDRSGLIWPAADGWGDLHAMIQWESGDYTELRDQFVRDPFGTPDTTATDHRPPSPGMQCFTKTHGIFVHPGVPLALRIAHNDDESRDLVLAEFKLVIYT